MGQAHLIGLVVVRIRARLLQQRVLGHPGHRGLPLRRVLVARVVQATVLGHHALHSRGGMSSTLGPLPYARLQLRLLRVRAGDKGVVLRTPAREFSKYFTLLLVIFRCLV